MPGLIAHQGWIVCAKWEKHKTLKPNKQQSPTNQDWANTQAGIGSLEAAELEAL